MHVYIECILRYEFTFWKIILLVLGIGTYFTLEACVWNALFVTLLTQSVVIILLFVHNKCLSIFDRVSQMMIFIEIKGP